MKSCLRNGLDWELSLKSFTSLPAHLISKELCTNTNLSVILLEANSGCVFHQEATAPQRILHAAFLPFKLIHFVTAEVSCGRDHSRWKTKSRPYVHETESDLTRRKWNVNTRRAILTIQTTWCNNSSSCIKSKGYSIICFHSRNEAQPCWFSDLILLYVI